jgi:5-methylthioadenosine/S-adenosylhomocysteine deaminase
VASLDLANLKESRFALSPDILLTPKGPQRDFVIVIDRGRIARVCPAADYAPTNGMPAAQRLPGRAIIPGFIDAHTHLGETFGKALIGGEPSQIWRRIWMPMENALDPHGCYVSAKWMFLEVLRGGHTAVVNYSLNDGERNAAVHQAAKEVGIRLVSAAGLDEFSTDSDGRGQRIPREEIFARAEEHIEQCNGSDLIYPSVCCSSFHGNSTDLIAALAEFCSMRNVLFQMHSNEHFPEVHDCLVKFGKRPIELFAEIGALGPGLILHHATLTTDKEIELLRTSRTAVSYNPVASQWKGNGVAPALAYAARGVRMGIGSDNTRADAFRALDAAESCQRVAHAMRVNDFSCGAAWTWVDAATRGSADACGHGHEFGSLIEGQAADFLILDMGQPETLPSWDFEWELVRYYNRDQIDAVIVNGNVVMAGGRPVAWDDIEFVREHTSAGIKIGSVPGIERRHGPSGGYRAREIGPGIQTAIDG